MSEMSRGGVRTVEQGHECVWPQERGLGSEAWVVICVQQRHHPHVKFKPAHRPGQSFRLRFNGITLTETITVICDWLKSPLSYYCHTVKFYLMILSQRQFKCWNRLGFLEKKLLDKLEWISILIPIMLSYVAASFHFKFPDKPRIISVIAAWWTLNPIVAQNSLCKCKVCLDKSYAHSKKHTALF